MAVTNKPAPPPIKYVTVEKSSILFDILLRGEVIYGQWDNDARDIVAFVVPAHLEEAMEAHWHIHSGRLVRKAEPVETKKDDGGDKK